ncbi:MAG: glutamate--tRNA ligase [Bryobacteraceae bacterium]|nr:glutamate--tRNA ligase [Bryobacteraceae bacterium]
MTTPAKQVRVRYAPSPTGDFHVGGARTALFNYLFARHFNGKFILRIEDTDQSRYKPEAVGWLLNGLQYLGMDWDEGPEAGGEFGPYVQTERLEIYRRYRDQLLEQGRAYRCFCTPERLEAASKEQQRRGGNPGYDRLCRDLDTAESARRAAAGERHTVRFKMPIDGETVVYDAIRGEIRFPNSNLQDTVLMKSDGIPTYHLANVVDDRLMEISHVLRGDEWVSSLPLHARLYEAFGWTPPVMAHLPLILNPAGKGKMSKREDRAPDGRVLPVFVRTFEELGYLPEAMINYLALLGWSFDDKTEIMSREELIERFSLERVNAAPAVWNYDKLDHLNGYYIRQLSSDALAERLLPFVRRAGFAVELEYMLKAAPLLQERITRLSDAAKAGGFFFADELPPYDSAELIPQKGDAAMARRVLERARQTLTSVDFSREALEPALRGDAEALGVKTGQMFQPVRVAVCGKKAAPPLFETLETLGRETCLKRIDQAVAKL